MVRRKLKSLETKFKYKRVKIIWQDISNRPIGWLDDSLEGGCDVV